jgi:MFS family permease
MSGSPYRRVSFLLFTAGWGANHFATLLVVYRARLGLSAAEVGLLFGAYALGLVPGLLLAGRMSDAMGRRALVLPASLAAIAASGVLAFGTHGFQVLLAGRLLFGLAMGSIMSPGSVWVQELSEPALGPRRATLSLSAGFGLGPLVTGVVAELAPAPLVLPYVVHASIMAFALVLVRGVPETAQRATTRGAKDEALQIDANKNRTPLGRVELLTLAALLPAAPWAFGFAAIACATLPGLMRAQVGRPVIYSALVIVTTLLSGVAVQSFVSRLGRRADLVGLALGAAGTFLGAHAVAVGSPYLVFVAAALAGSGYGLVITSGLRLVAESAAPERRGTAVGVYYVLTYIGFVLPSLHAVVAKSWGDVTTLRATGALVLASLVIRALIAARRA